MGVSFKVARVGTRYKPQLVPIEDKSVENASENDAQQRSVEGNLSLIGAENVDDSNKKDKNVLHSMSEELEVCFSLNLFKDGFSIGKANEFLSDVPKHLHPYDKASETLFSAIEYGWLPGEMLDNIPGKYINGTLMCEIRDYRTILPCKVGHASLAGSAPIVHMMILHLCMEIVVKDILSLSNDSWTYKDLLEIESCIIKALQPDLHLNPEPLWGNFFGDAPRKKLDLGIAWSWKKRKLSDVPAHSLPIRNSNLVNDVHGDCLIQKPRPQSGSLEETRSTSSMQENISNHFCYPQEINSALDYTSPSCALVVHKTPSFVSVPNQLLSTVNTIAPGNPIVQGICGKQAIEGLPYKKPKQEPVDLPKLQLLGSKVNIAPQGPELRWVDNALQEQLKVEKILCENKKRKFNFPLPTHDDQMVLRGNQNQLTGAPSVKQEPAETRGLHTDYIYMDSRTDPSGLHSSKQKFSLKPSRVNSSSIHSFNHIVQPSDKYLKNGNAFQNRKNLKNSQVTAPDVSLSTTSQNGNSLQRPASINVGQKNLRSEGLKTDMADSFVSKSSTYVTNVNNPTVKGLSLLRPSVELNIAIDRLLKIVRVSERYGMTNRKCKLDQAVGQKPSSCQTPHLVGFHLAKLEDSGKSGDSTGYKISPSKYSSYRKTRTLIFSHEIHTIQGCDSPMVDREAQIKLVMLENLDLGTVEAQVYYGCEEENPISIPLLPTLPSTLHSANCFARQFTSLMVREGYCITSDQVGSSAYHRDGESGVEKQANVSNVILTYGTISPSSEMWPAGPSPTMQNSSTIRMPFHDLAQSPLQSILSGVNFTATGNNISSLQPTQRSSSRSQVDNLQQQMRSLQQWWQKGTNKFSWLQYQRELLRHRQEQELLRTESMVDLSASASGQDIVPLNDGIPRIRNIDPSSSGNTNILGNNGCTPILSGGVVHWLKSLGFCNNLENNHISGLNDKQLFCALSGQLAAFRKLNTSQDLGGRGLICGLPTQRNASMLAIAKPDALDMRNIFNNRGTSQQLRMMQQEEIRSMLQPQKMASSANPVGSPLPLVPSLHDQRPRLIAHQLNPVAMSTLPQMNPGSISGSGNPEVSSWTHGSVGSSKT